MRVTSWVIPAALVIGACLDARRASACSAPPECPQRTFVLPADGSIGVPTNTEIEISYYVGCRGWFCEGRTERARLRAAGGADVALGTSGTTGRMRPAVELAPGTTYEIVDLDYASSVHCAEGETIPEIVIARFTTGSGPDLVAPSAPGGLRAGACRAESCDSSACCGPYEATSNSVAWDASTDDTGGLIGYLHTGDGGLHYGTTMGVYTFSSSWPGAHYTDGYVRLGFGPSRVGFVVSAVDLAGNVSVPSETIEVDLACAPAPDAGAPDAGAPAVPDAGRARDAGRSADAGSGGAPPSGGGSCSASRARDLCVVAHRLARDHGAREHGAHAEDASAPARALICGRVRRPALPSLGQRGIPRIVDHGRAVRARDERARVLLHVPRSADIGSPRVIGSTSDSRIPTPRPSIEARRSPRRLRDAPHTMLSRLLRASALR